MLEKEGDKLRDDIRDTFQALLLALLMLDFSDSGVYNNINLVVDKWAKQYLLPIFNGMKSTISKITKEVNSYFEELGFKPTDKASNAILKQLGLKGATKGTYLGEVAKLEDIKQKLKGYVTTSMSAGRTRAEFNDGLRALFEENGMVDKYFRTYAYDMYSQAHRVVSTVKAKELGLTRFLYAGTIIDTTRDFCAERAGNVYTIDEAKEWNDLNWRGKIEGVDVLIQLGGYNCRHYMRYKI